jgi:uncharacterized DUF497 family protein
MKPREGTARQDMGLFGAHAGAQAPHTLSHRVRQRRGSRRWQRHCPDSPTRPRFIAEDKRHTPIYTRGVKPFRWPTGKNAELIAQRGLSFEQVVIAIESGGLLQVVAHPNPARYPRQKIMVVAWDGYAHLVPFVEEEDHYFLKTIIPSRKATRDFIQKEQD